jgi:hypothetical protein
MKNIKVIIPLQSNFFPAKFFFGFWKLGILAGKNLLFKRVNLLHKEGFSKYKTMGIY